MWKVNFTPMLEHFRVCEHVWLVKETLNESDVTRVVKVLFGFLHSPEFTKIYPRFFRGGGAS
jgi:hypothetical protein